jgi:hypothetical protein
MQFSRRRHTSGLRTLGTLVTLASTTGLVLACNIGAGDAEASAANRSAANTAADGLVYGEAVTVGHGTARVYVQLAGGAPVEVGVALSEAALSGLPDNSSPGGHAMPDGMKTFPFALTMPENNPTPYLHVGLDWNPGGHEPPGIYNTPHFDFHFYTVTEAERHEIMPTNPEFAAKAAHYPPADRVPAGYVAPAPTAIPMMGVHWVDPTSPELNGKPFDKTFIYGSWDGKLIFAEPMITKAFLESRPDFTAPVAVPQQYGTPGYYTTSYSIRWDDAAREYRVALGGLQRR